MTMARKTLVDESVSGVYHCVSRCVRRAFLCGFDTYSGRDFEHRKAWIRQRLGQLSGIFGTEVLAYAVMSNHLHLVVRTTPELTREWTNKEVAKRWLRLFPIQRDPKGRPLDPEPWMVERFCDDQAQVKTCRERLGSLSWFMRCLNEPIARRANKEDDCTGRFWEGRFKCQRLVDEGAILACMAYVDLNPVRAGLAETPEASEFTSFYDRVMARQAAVRSDTAPKSPEESSTEPNPEEHQAFSPEVAAAKTRAGWLRGFGEDGSEPIFAVVDLDRYLELVDWTGRSLKAGKTGRIPAELEPILERLSLDNTRWVENVEQYGSLFYRLVGRVEQLVDEAKRRGQRWFKGKGGGASLYLADPV